jgi:GT2 family glycosyltransferase
MLTVSVAVFDPDLNIFQSFIKSLSQFTPEMTQLLVYDNGSESKEFVNVINQYFGPSFSDSKVNLKITHGDKNIGFGAAHNRNLSHANGKYFAVLNDDIEFFENWATPMLEIFENDKKVAQVGPKANVFNVLAGNKIGNWEDTEEPEYCEASCLIIPTSLAKKYRLFDEHYQFGYFEDMDLSLRLRKDGYILRNADIKWQHHRGTTTMRLIAKNFDLPGYYINNEYLFKKRWNAYLFKKRFGKTIVIKREGDIADVFLTLPIIDTIKKKNPDSVILLMSQFSDAVEGCFDIDGYLKYNAPEPCDLLIDLDYAFEKDFRKHIVDCYAEIAQVRPQKKTSDLYFENKDMEYIKNLVKDFPGFIALDYHDNTPGKKWKKTDYMELGRRLKQDGHPIITVGKTAEQHPDHLDADMNLINVLNLQQTALVISRSRLFIGSDGLLAHFAQTTRVPHIVLYGCTLPEYVADTSLPMFFPIVAPVACRGCRHRYSAGKTVMCARNFACMDTITVDMVYEETKELLSKLIAPAQ